jgi:hypothetical protein
VAGAALVCVAFGLVGCTGAGTTTSHTTTTIVQVDDLNQDGRVDCTDQFIFFEELNGTSSDLAGDLDHDGAVTAADLTLFRKNFAGTWPPACF